MQSRERRVIGFTLLVLAMVCLVYAGTHAEHHYPLIDMATGQFSQKTSFNEKTMPWFIASIVLGGGGIFALVSAAKVATKTGPPER